MNVARDYKPDLYGYLNIPVEKISKVHLGRIITKYLKDRNLQVHDEEMNTTYINMDHTLQELTGIRKDRVYLWVGHTMETDWWEIVTKIHTKWKV